MEQKRIAWAITGAGHALEECIDTALSLDKVDIFLSRAAEEVMRTYRLEERITVPKIRIYQETKSSAPQVVRLFAGDYRVLVVAPATSNSVAKFALGISDTLVTNLFAQAGKCRLPVVVFPTDIAPEMESVGPKGQKFRVYPRPVDLENTERIKSFAGVTVVFSQDELRRRLAAI